jgi:hypothetical protein
MKKKNYSVHVHIITCKRVKKTGLLPNHKLSRQTNCMTRMISRDYHFRYHSAYYIVYHRFLPKKYTKLFSIKGCCFCCCCFQCNFPYLIVGIRAWFSGKNYTSREVSNNNKTCPRCRFGHFWIWWKNVGRHRFF